jgi:hypothetical protein
MTEIGEIAGHQISEDQLNQHEEGGLSRYFDEEYN